VPAIERDSAKYTSIEAQFLFFTGSPLKAATFPTLDPRSSACRFGKRFHAGRRLTAVSSVVAQAQASTAVGFVSERHLRGAALPSHLH
jgi:hypothetical protein